MHGVPLASSSETSASPTASSPIAVSTSSFGFARIVLAAAFTAFWSRGVNARSACCTRLPSCARTLSGMSSGFCVTKYTPTPLLRTRRTTSSIRSTSASGASSNSRCASSKKNASLGLSRSAHLGQQLEQLREHPEQERRVQARRREQLVRGEHVHHAAPVDRLDEVGDLEHRLAEEPIPALLFEL